MDGPAFPRREPFRHSRHRKKAMAAGDRWLAKARHYAGAYDQHPEMFGPMAASCAIHAIRIYLGAFFGRGSGDPISHALERDLVEGGRAGALALIQTVELRIKDGAPVPLSQAEHVISTARLIREGEFG